MKSTGLLFLVAGVITAMGALFHVNAIWLYGPYDTGAATSYSQPDWYIGFLEGSLRLFPPWETRIGRFMINNLVYSGVIIPGSSSGLLVVPWIERRFTKDDREHHLLDRPRDAPHRTAAGVAAITFVAVLFLGGSQDVIAGTFDVSIGHVTTILQIAARRAADRLLRDLAGCAGSLAARPGPSAPSGPGSCATPAAATTRPPTDEEEAPTTARSTVRIGGGGDRPGRLAAAAHRAGRGHRPDLGRCSSSPPSSSARLVAVLLSSSSSASAAGTTACPPGAREHPARGDLHGRPAADRGRAVRRHVRLGARSIDADADDADLIVEVIGFQWQWQFDYPESGRRVIGTEQLEPELVLPAGATVRFDLTSVDVIHSFWIPGFRFKRDVFPGRRQTFQVDVGDRTGSLAGHRRLRRVLRPRPPQDALLGAHRDARRVRVSGGGAGGGGA